MPNPVPVLTSPVALTDEENTKIEAFVTTLLQVFRSGSTGLSNPLLNTDATIYSQSPNQDAAAMVLASRAQQLFFRQLGVALAKNFTGGGTDPTPQPGTGVTFEGVCLATDQVGDFVYMAGAGLTTRLADPSDLMKIPAVGCIVSKPTSTSGVVQTSGVVSGVFAGLTPGRPVYVDRTGRAVSPAPTPDVGESLFIQAVGIALDSNLLLLVPSTTLVRVHG